MTLGKPILATKPYGISGTFSFNRIIHNIVRHQTSFLDDQVVQYQHRKASTFKTGVNRAVLLKYELRIATPFHETTSDIDTLQAANK